MVISNMKEPIRTLMTIGEVMNWSGPRHMLSRMKQNLDDGILNNLGVSNQKRIARCVTNQVENSATPKVNSTQEVVYRPYNHGQEINFSQHRNQGQNRDANFQRNDQNFWNDQNY